MAISRPLLPASAWNTDPVLRVHRNDLTFSMEVPASYFGPETVLGSYPRLEQLAKWVRQLDLREAEVDSAIKWIRYQAKRSTNAAWFAEVKALEDRFEEIARAQLKISPRRPPAEPTPFVPATSSARPYVAPAEVSAVISRLSWDGSLFHVDIETGDVYFTHPNRYRADAAEREILQNNLAVTRSIILDGYRLQHPTRLTGDKARKLEPEFPHLEETWMPPVTEEMTAVAEQPGLIK